jgi:uncharacterized DUF497 family protein
LKSGIFVATFNGVKIVFARAKRDRCFEERGLAFEDAAEIFAAVTLDDDDNRRDYGERRVVTYGHLRGRLVCVVWTPRGGARHVISMRYANEREKRRFAKRSQEG